MEADNEKGAYLVWVWLLHNAPEQRQRQGFSREQVTCLGIISLLQNITISFKWW